MLARPPTRSQQQGQHQARCKLVSPCAPPGLLLIKPPPVCSSARPSARLGASWRPCSCLLPIAHAHLPMLEGILQYAPKQLC